MSYVAIPSEIFESAEYKALSLGSREFLLRLYHFFGDCETFTVNPGTPEQYGEGTTSAITQKLKKLIRGGMLVIHERQWQNRYDSRPRVLKFKYSAVAAYQ